MVEKRIEKQHRLDMLAEEVVRHETRGEEAAVRRVPDDLVEEGEIVRRRMIRAMPQHCRSSKSDRSAANESVREDHMNRYRPSPRVGFGEQRRAGSEPNTWKPIASPRRVR